MDYTATPEFHDWFLHHSEVSLAYLATGLTGPVLMLHPAPDVDHSIEYLQMDHVLPTAIRRAVKLRRLTCLAEYPAEDVGRVLCYDEPIPLGVQVQPRGANYAGTAGAPAYWVGPDDVPRWGFLTCWHVAGFPDFPIGHPQHQPTDEYPEIGLTAAQVGPLAGEVNRLDCALVDTKLGPFHSTAWRILGLPSIAPAAVSLSAGDPVVKSGRTSGVTRGTVEAVHACARVGYDDRTFAFCDLDVIRTPGDFFSRPGDSGSLVCRQQGTAPAALLFAGGEDITLAIPLRNVSQWRPLSFVP